jgi:hypothetical protein
LSTYRASFTTFALRALRAHRADLAALASNTLLAALATFTTRAFLSGQALCALLPTFTSCTLLTALAGFPSQTHLPIRPDRPLLAAFTRRTRRTIFTVSAVFNRCKLGIDLVEHIAHVCDKHIFHARVHCAELCITQRHYLIELFLFLCDYMRKSFSERIRHQQFCW